jgi:hypothetical protein
MYSNNNPYSNNNYQKMDNPLGGRLASVSNRNAAILSKYNSN